MLVYTENNNLVRTSLESPHSNVDLMLIRSEANNFRGKENRFYKIVSTEIISRDIKHLSRESMNGEAIKRFRDYTNVYYSDEFYDKKNNLGYKIYPFMKKNPTIFTYSLIYPAITEFFQFWDNYSKNESKSQPLPVTYDLSKLFDSMENFHDLNLLFLREDGEQLKKSLYQNFPEFSIFYYEIYPHINVEVVGTYDITKLVNARLQAYELGLETVQFDQLISSIPVADNNAKVLRLIKNPKVDFNL